jgi:uncharacterized membrane protein HdeD (DUF308 family)
MFKSVSTSLIARGVFAIIFGTIALAWPGVTIVALVLLFAVFAFMEGFTDIARAFDGSGAASAIGHVLLALIDLTAGVIAVAWPVPTALVLTLLVGIWALAGGVFEIAGAFMRGESAGARVIFIVSGIISVAFGAIIVDRPDIGVVTVALLFGLFAVVRGVTLIMQGNELRRGV